MIEQVPKNTELRYPEHKHPHGADNTPPNEFRLWVCEECRHIFTDEEIRQDKSKGNWGHSCKAHPCRKGQRCEAHLEPYMPDALLFGPKGRKPSMLSVEELNQRLKKRNPYSPRTFIKAGDAKPDDHYYAGCYDGFEKAIKESCQLYESQIQLRGSQ